MQDPVWRDAWGCLNQRFARTAASVRECNSRMNWNYGTNSTERMPFRAWAAFSRDGHPGGEDLVVSVDVERDQNVLVFKCDIARDGVLVLAQTESVVVGWRAGDAVTRDEVLAAVARIDGFLVSHLPLIRAELCSPAVPEEANGTLAGGEPTSGESRIMPESGEA